MLANAKVWGHRGCRGIANPPENSLGAFSAAIEQGASGIELDVFPTKDDELVVFHDETLERMTGGCGQIMSFTMRELKQFQLKNAKGELTAERIPSLAEVIECINVCRAKVAALPDSLPPAEFVLNIEIKRPACASKVDEIIRCSAGPSWRYHNFLVSSFDLGSLREMRNWNSNVPIGVLFEGPLGHPEEPWDVTEAELERCLAEVGDIKPQTVNLVISSLTRRAVEMIWEVNAAPIAWTCNERPPEVLSDSDRRSLARELRSTGANIITDYPAQMIHLLNSYE